MVSSILARDSAFGALGAAVATRFFAVGALAIHVAGDAGREHRRAHILDAGGRIASFTGANRVSWCGAVRGVDVSAAGGDSRGKQSAALKIATRDPYSDLDIRADDRPDTIREPRRLYAVSRERFAVFRRFLPNADPA